MPRDKNVRPLELSNELCRLLAACPPLDPISHLEQRIDDRVSRHKSVVRRNSLTKQRLPVIFGCRKMPGGKPCRQHSVHFFRKRFANVACSQSGFDVTDRHVGIKRTQCRTERRRRVSLNDRRVRFELIEDRWQFFEDSRTQSCERLSRLHQIQIGVRRDRKQLKNLIEHLAVLSRHTDAGFELRVSGDRVNQRRHLDRFGPSPENQQHALHAALLVYC